MGSIELYTVDAMGNVLTGSGAISMQLNGAIAPGGSNWSYSRSYNSNNAQGRMTGESSSGGSRVFEYDGAGNNDWQKLLGGGATPSEHRALRYDGLGRLRRAELAWVAQTGLFPAAPYKEGTEDSYYDALGRRVLTATSSVCSLGAAEVQTYCQASAAVRRTIWTGDQELAEIQMPNDATYGENDTGPTSVAVATGFDRNPYYGRVVYAQGPTVDQPLSVTRFGYTDSDNNVAVAWPTFTIVPLANWRSQSFLTAFATGDLEQPFTPGGTSCAATGAQRCVLVPRPAQYSMWEQQRGYTPPAWHGSLIEDKRESLVGLTYRRNRYYDPTSGRFTQEDPIGLAGGLNLYGFADGDPVNFSDPFGLCPPADSNVQDCASVEYWRQRAASSRSMAGRVGNTVMAGLAAVGEDVLAETQGYAVGACGTRYECGTPPNIGMGPGGAAGALGQMERQLAKDGAGSVLKTIRKLTQRIAIHEADIEKYRAAGGHVTSMEREVRAWRETLDAARKVLGIP